MKKYLRQQEPVATIRELQAQVDTFCQFYNEVRPHRSLQRRTPRDAYGARLKASPVSKGVEQHFRVRHDKINTNGSLTLRYGTRLYHIGMGRNWAGQVVTMLIANRDVRVITPEGELIRHLELDPSKDYQPQSADLMSTMS